MKFNVRFIESEEFHIVDDFCREQGLSLLHPLFSKVVVGADEGAGRVAGLVAAQMVIHSEPIWIAEEYRGTRLWKELTEALDSYLTVVGAAGVYNQPTNPTAVKLVERMGYTRSDYPLYVKVYKQPEEPWLQQR